MVAKKAHQSNQGCLAELEKASTSNAYISCISAKVGNEEDT
jgi:hypothetical protein